MNERIRAKDAALGEIHKNYVEYLQAKLKGDPTDVELTTADHQGIRNILKDNNIVVEPDIDNEANLRKDITLTLVDAEVTTTDILGAAGVG